MFDLRGFSYQPLKRHYDTHGKLVIDEMIFRISRLKLRKHLLIQSLPIKNDNMKEQTWTHANLCSQTGPSCFSKTLRDCLREPLYDVQIKGKGNVIFSGVQGEFLFDLVNG